MNSRRRVNSDVERLILFMRILLSIILIAVAGVASAQPQEASPEEIAALVAQLSWDSVGGECNFVWRIYPEGPAAKRLLEIGKPASAELLKVLTDDTKGVAAHVILSTIWEPENIEIQNRSDGNDFVHVYNKLEWRDHLNFKKKKVTHSVNRVNLARISVEWRAKLAGKL